MSVTPFHYQDSELRVIDRDGEPWFVLADLCKALGVANASNVSARLDDDMRGVHQMETLGGPQEMTVVNEAGMYEVILRSDKPEAKAFRRWVTTEVLPAIRKRGAYLSPQTIKVALHDPDFIIRLATQLKAERARTNELIGTLAEQNERLSIVEPKARAFDRWLSSNVNYFFSQVGKALRGAGAKNVGPRRLFRFLGDEPPQGLGWIYRDIHGRWQPYQNQVEAGRLALRLGSQFNTRTGEVFETVTVRITAKGAADLAVQLGVMPRAVAEALKNDQELAARAPLSPTAIRWRERQRAIHSSPFSPISPKKDTA